MAFGKQCDTKRCVCSGGVRALTTFIFSGRRIQWLEFQGRRDGGRLLRRKRGRELGPTSWQGEHDQSVGSVKAPASSLQTVVERVPQRRSLNMDGEARQGASALPFHTRSTAWNRRWGLSVHSNRAPGGATTSAYSTTGPSVYLLDTCSRNWAGPSACTTASHF